MLITVIDDAHLVETENPRKLRLLLEDFPKDHNLNLVGQVELLSNLDLAVNAEDAWPPIAARTLPATNGPKPSPASSFNRQPQAYVSEQDKCVNTPAADGYVTYACG